MKVTRTEIPDVMLIEPKVFGDTRGFFFESFNARAFAEQTGVGDTVRSRQPLTFGSWGSAGPALPDPESRKANWCVWSQVKFLTLRSIYVARHPRLANGSAHCCPNRIRPSFGCPPGLPTVLSCCRMRPEFLYKTTEYYAPEHEQCIAWNDPFLNIRWPDLGEEPKLSAKDAAGVAWAAGPIF
jgi:dTDP-4-dehydrorhamnose 3,5-epimerase